MLRGVYPEPFALRPWAEGPRTKGQSPQSLGLRTKGTRGVAEGLSMTDKILSHLSKIGYMKMSRETKCQSSHRSSAAQYRRAFPHPRW